MKFVFVLLAILFRRTKKKSSIFVLIKGIQRRCSDPPPDQEGNQWRWNDRALSYRPRGAW